jgi:hypothetical protein
MHYLSLIIRYASEQNLAPVIGEKAFEVLLWMCNDITEYLPYFEKSKTILSCKTAKEKIRELEKLCEGNPDLSYYVDVVDFYLYGRDYSFLEKQDGEGTTDNN